VIDKEEFYRGAALSLLLEDLRCKSVRRLGKGGYVAHDKFFQVRFTTKARSPWGFAITEADIERFNSAQQEVTSSLLVLVCGGDGLCVLKLPEVSRLLGGNAGWISVRRKHNTQYEVRGTSERLDYKITRNRWPAIIFEERSK
jgi:hypothetical protein